MQALSQLSYGPGTQEIGTRPQSLRVTSHSSVAGRCGFILLQPRKIKMKIQSLLRFWKPDGFRTGIKFVLLVVIVVIDADNVADVVIIIIVVIGQERIVVVIIVDLDIIIDVGKVLGFAGTRGILVGFFKRNDFDVSRITIGFRDFFLFLFHFLDYGNFCRLFEI